MQVAMSQDSFATLRDRVKYDMEKPGSEILDFVITTENQATIVTVDAIAALAYNPGNILLSIQILRTRSLAAEIAPPQVLENHIMAMIFNLVPAPPAPPEMFGLGAIPIGKESPDMRKIREENEHVQFVSFEKAEHAKLEHEKELFFAEEKKKLGRELTIDEKKEREKLWHEKVDDYRKEFAKLHHPSNHPVPVGT